MSQYLNYFIPYAPKRQDENTLTRAFMSLVRLSPIIQQGFYEMIREAANGHDKLELQDKIPPYHNLESLEVEAKIQEQSLLEGDYYLSVLISSEYIDLKENITADKRTYTAQYDGLFSIGGYSFFIENKPHNDIKEIQLCPAAKDFEDKDENEYHLYNFPINFIWRDIITYLNKLIDNNILNSTLTQLVDDFFAHVDFTYPHLNPFDKFHLCKSKALVNRRLESVFHNIALHKEAVVYHKGWAQCIETPNYHYLGKIGAPVWYDEYHNWAFYLSFIMADTTHQARHFYKWNKELDIQRLLDFKRKKINQKDWVIKGNFHLGFMQANIAFFQTADKHFEKYLNHWKNNPIKQINANEGDGNVFPALHDYLTQLQQEEIIIYDEKMKAEVVKAFGGVSRRKKASVRPGISVVRAFNKKEAEELDRNNQLENKLKAEINDFFLALTGGKADFIKN